MPEFFGFEFREVDQSGDLRVIACTSRRILLYGPAACGKSVCAKAIMAESTDIDHLPVRGRLRFGDNCFEFGNKPTSLRLGYIPEDMGSRFIASKVIDEISLSMLYLRGDANFRISELVRWRKQSLLSELSNSRISELSGGQKTLLAIEAALSAKPDSLIIDSGLEALDSRYMEYAINIIEAYLNEDPRRYLVVLARTSDLRYQWPELDPTPFPTPYLNSIKSDWHDHCSTAEGEERQTLKSLAAIEYVSVTGGYRSQSKWIIRSLDGVFFSGECIGITGANGVGKSTLLKMLSGYLPIKSGEVRFFDVGLSSGVWPGIVDGIAYFAQDCEALIAYGDVSGKYFPQSGQPGSKQNQDLMSNAVTKTQAQTLSPGERFIVAVGRAMACKPRLWVFDEPTGHIQRSELIRIITHIRSFLKPATVVLVSHDCRFLRKVCDSIYEVRQNEETLLICQHQRQRKG